MPPVPGHSGPQACSDRSRALDRNKRLIARRARRQAGFFFGRHEMTAKNGRGDRIRTYDLLVPNQALYQTKLHPVDVAMGGVNGAAVNDVC
jgi:hypothetical protein